MLTHITRRPGERRLAWRWFQKRIALSVWTRQWFTFAVARDVYDGVPAIYVNYLDYDEDPDHPRLTYSQPYESSYSTKESWRTVLTHAAQRIFQWLQHPWVEPVVAGSVTLVSLLLLVG